jgi:MoaA/NifB/PqqE/SkfB family radical SAM enzyme
MTEEYDPSYAYSNWSSPLQKVDIYSSTNIELLLNVLSKDSTRYEIIDVTDYHKMTLKQIEKELGYKINFTGGEITANKSFIPLLKHIRSSNVKITHVGITTNGSASKNYYLELATLLDSISFSTHSEFFNEKEFFSKVHSVNQVMHRPQKSVHVNIMDEFWNQERSLLYIKWLKDHKISHSINTINYNRKTRDLPTMQGVYNIEQL